MAKNGSTFNIVITSDKSAENLLKRAEQAGARKPLKQEKTERGTVLTYPVQMGKKSQKFFDDESKKRNKNIAFEGYITKKINLSNLKASKTFDANLQKTIDTLAEFMRKNITEVSPSFKRKYPTLTPQLAEDILPFQTEAARIGRKVRKREGMTVSEKQQLAHDKKVYAARWKLRRSADRSVLRLQKLRHQYTLKQERAVEKLRVAQYKKRITNLKSIGGLLKQGSTLSLALNMSMLGIMFSFMSFFGMISGMFGTLLKSASDLTGAVTGGAMAQAFLPGLGREGMDVSTLIEGYKTSLGIQGEMQYQIAKFASTLLSNTDILDSILYAIGKFSEKLADPVFIDKVVKAAVEIIDMIPSILNALNLLVDLTTRFMPLIEAFLPLILSSVILLPVLSLMNAIIGTILMAASLIVGIIEILIARQEIGRVTSLAAQLVAPATAATTGGGVGASLGTIIAEAFTVGAVITSLIYLAAIFVGAIIGLLVVGLMDAIGVLDFIGNLGKAFGDWLRTNPLGQLAIDFLTVMLAPMTILGSIFVGFVQGGLDGAIEKFWEAVEIVSGAFGRIRESLLSAISSAVDWIWNAVSSAVDWIWNTLSDFSLSDTISGLLGFATGGYVSNTGLAMVHEGEYISNTSEPVSSGNVQQNVNITVYGDLDSAAADKVVDELVAQQRYSSWS